MDMVIIMGLVALLLVGVLWARSNEKKLWNDGICAKYNEPWRFFDMDSQGGRGYKCCDEVLWISYGVDARSA